MKKSIVALGIVLALSGCASAADETLAAEPAALVEISPATEENAQPVEAAATAEPAQTATPEPTPEPTQAPTPAPTAEPTAVPTAEPTQAPVEETVAAAPAQVSMSYGAVPFDAAVLALGLLDSLAVEGDVDVSRVEGHQRLHGGEYLLHAVALERREQFEREAGAPGGDRFVDDLYDVHTLFGIIFFTVSASIPRRRA